MSGPWWRVLHIPRNADRSTIRRAYAAQLKTTSPEDDPQGFMALREAYEAGLEAARYGAGETWAGDYAPTADAQDAAAMGASSGGEGLGAEGSGAGRWQEADGAPGPERTEPTPEPYEAQRAEEIADLNQRISTLVACLSGPWAVEKDQVQAFEAILASPALLEVEVLAQVEEVVARILADHIPRSDTLLLRAIEHFGWDASRDTSPAIDHLLRRLDAWHFIHALQSGKHAWSPGWRALTDERAGALSRRVAGLSNSKQQQVRALLEVSEAHFPGLTHSFTPNALHWWQAFVAKPRLTWRQLMVPLIGLLAGLLLLAQARSVDGYFWSGLGVTAGFVGLILAYRLWMMPIHFRNQRGEAVADGARWRMGLWFALTLVMMVLPGTIWTAGLLSVAVLALGISIYFLDSGFDPAPLFKRGIAAFACAYLVACFDFGGLPVHVQMLTVAYALAFGLVCLGGVSTWARLTRSAPYLWAVGMIALGVAAAILTRPWGMTPESTRVLGGAGCTMYLMATALRDSGAGVNITRLAWLGRLISFVMIVASVGAAFSQFVQGGVNALAPRTSLERWEANGPEYQAVRTGNPQLHAQIAEVLRRRDVRVVTRKNAHDEIDLLVNQAYRERIPRVTNALLVAKWKLELENLRLWRSNDPVHCNRNAPVAPKNRLAAEALGERHYKHGLMVAAGAPVSAEELAAGTPLSIDALFMQVAGGSRPKAMQLADDLNRKNGGLAECDARIALSTGLLWHPEPVVAATMRAHFLNPKN